MNILVEFFLLEGIKLILVTEKLILKECIGHVQLRVHHLAVYDVSGSTHGMKCSCSGKYGNNVTGLSTLPHSGAHGRRDN